MRTILHSDLNNCYATIECMHRPDLRGKCVAVGGLAEDRHGIVLAKSVEAKACGIKTGEPFWMARQKCPELIVLPPNFPLYMRYCAAAREIYGEYTDRVEPFGMDEAWLDVGGSEALFGDGREIAEKIRKRVKRELGITVSVGVSFNKVFAKLGSDLKKPDAVTVIDKVNYREKVWPLPVQELLMIGKATSDKLNRYGIETIGQLAQADENFIYRILGKAGITLLRYARGEDSSPVMRQDEFLPLKSVSNSTTPPRDISTDDDAAVVLSMLSESVGRRLRKYGVKSRVLQVSIRDSKLTTVQHQKQLARATDCTTEITAVALELFRQACKWDNPIRSLGIHAGNLETGEDCPQLSVYEDEKRRLKREKLDRTTDMLCSRFGKDAIRYGLSMLDSTLVSQGRNNPVVLPYTEATIERARA